MFTRVDDRLHDHPKFLKCSLSARGLWVTALSWVGDKLTDGFVPHSCLGRLGARKRDADRLVEAGLWERGECDGEPGYWFHDFEDWNKAATHDEVRKRAGQNRSRVLKHRTRRSVVYKQKNAAAYGPGHDPRGLVDAGGSALSGSCETTAGACTGLSSMWSGQAVVHPAGHGGEAGALRRYCFVRILR